MSQWMLSRHALEPLLDMRRDFDRAFDHFFRHPALRPQLSEAVFAEAPLIESWVDEGDKKFHLTMPLPGLTPEEITLHLQGKTLVLSAEHNEEANDSGKTFLEREISTRSLRRTVTLPDGVDGDKLSAKLSDGVLEITAPIAQSALPKKIQINAESKTGTPAKAETKTGKAA
jgi:HSP20 family protein